MPSKIKQTFVTALDNNINDRGLGYARKYPCVLCCNDTTNTFKSRPYGIITIMNFTEHTCSKCRKITFSRFVYPASETCSQYKTYETPKGGFGIFRRVLRKYNITERNADVELILFIRPNVKRLFVSGPVNLYRSYGIHGTAEN